MKLGSRYRKSERQSCLFLLMFLLNLKCGYFRSLDIECDWSVQRLSCPPYTTTDWDCLRKQLNCTNGREYHCLRDESGEWTEACAKPITCSKGKEPILKNFQIVCTNCKNPDRYEPIDGTESYKYSECRRIKTSCPRGNSYECLVDESVQYAHNRQCRCAHEKDYMPQNYDLNTDTWICIEPDDLNCIHAPCPEDVYGNAQTRNEKYRCERLLSPVTLTPSKQPTDKTSHQIVTQSATRTNIESVPEAETAVYPHLVEGLILGMFVFLSISLILFLIVYYMKRRYKIGTPVSLTASEEKYFELTLSWGPPQGYKVSPTHYKLEKREDSSPIWNKIDTISAVQTVYCVSGLKEGTLYNFRVTAKKQWSKSEPEECQAQTKCTTVPSAPLELIGRFDFEAKRINLRWKKPEDDGGIPVVDYLVQYSSDGEWTDCVPARANTEWTSNNFTGGVSYNFRVCARNKMGSSIPAELKEKIKYRSIPGKPTDISVTNISGNRLTLKWKSPESDGGDSITSYLIRQKEDERGWQQLHEVKSNTLSVLIKNLKLGKSYRFGVSSVNRIGESNSKETESAVVARETGCPDKPERADKDLQIGHSHVVLRWKQPKDDGGLPLLGYVVKENRLLWKKTCQDLEPEITTLPISELSENTSYTFLVYARNEKGMSDPLELKIQTTRKANSELQKSKFKSETDSTKTSAEVKDSELQKSKFKSETDSTKTSAEVKGTSTRPTEINIEVKDSKVIVSWKPPTDASIKVKEYDVWLKRDVNDWIVNQTVKEPKCQAKVEHLNSDINYYFGVCAKFQNGGQSDFIIRDAPVVLQEKKVGVFCKKSLKLKTQEGYQHEETVVYDRGESAQSDKVQVTETNEAPSKTKDETGLPSEKQKITGAARKIDTNQLTSTSTDSSNNGGLADRQNRGMVVKEKNVEVEEATEATEDISVKTMLKVVPDHFSEETPGPPEDFIVNPIGLSSCTLRWKQPKKCGGSSCTGYVVKKRESAATEWIEVEELKSEVLNCTIRELPYNKDIFFSVAAKNSFGMGQAAETYKPRTIKNLREALTPVGPVECSVLGDCSVQLTWRSPNVEASTITGYIIEYLDTKETMQSWTFAGSVTPEKTSFVVKAKFEENHEYLFRIFSNTAEGNSEELMSKKVEIRLVQNEKGCGKHAEGVRQTIIGGNQGKGNEELQSKKADGLKDETDSSVTGGDAEKTRGDAAEGQEKEEKALEMLKLLKKIVQWEDFIRHATGIEPLLKDSWSIPNKTVSDLTGVAEYKTSSESLSGGLTAYECPDDGNSLFNSVSLILFGNTSRAYRLRLAAVADGIEKVEFYKNQHFGKRNKDGVIQLMHSYFSKTSLEQLALDERGKEDEIRQIATRTAVRETAMPESKCNPLQVQFLSSATGFHIKQHYEKQSQAVYENVTQKSIDVVPHRSRKDTNKPSSKQDSYIHILWVSEQNQKIAGRTVINRIYPVIKKDG